ncbi:DMT family transporter [Nisaea acidiphila]|uniref:DMT family transporter n=1 Tax=Nisaea acidiphila TaxID=1862145 RepID=A0A9J7AXG1_9PROT|nr:DMT family transporter [Nisaea acidiphila]UUX51121.1 DMT family transporter [Nisaea acidiphila]
MSFAPLRELQTRFSSISPNLQGMFWIALSGLVFSCFMAIVRYVGATLDPVQTGFLRYAFALVFMAPFFLKLRPSDIRNAKLPLHALRGFLHGTGVLLWFYAMSRMPLAEVTAMGFTAPVYTTLLAALFLGEAIRFRRIMAIIIGLMGALIIIRPGFAVVDPGAIAMLVAAPIFACADIVAKKLTLTETGPAVVAYLSVFVTLFTFIPALYVWRTPTIEELLLVLITAGLATLGHLLMTQGFKVAEMSAIQPIKFVQLVWSALIGFAIFGEVPEIFTWIGAAIIVGSITYIAHREAVARRRRRALAET